jgi:hypothetical protein
MYDISFIAVGAAILGSVAALMGAMLSFFQLRTTRYLEERHRVELDKSRVALERQMDRLHEELYRDKGRWNELNHLVLDSVKASNRADENLVSQKFGSAGTRFLSSMGIDPNIDVDDERSIFVLTPLSEDHLPEFETIRQTCVTSGFTVRRGDEVKIEGSILPFIVSQIAKASLVIANINGRNPNVLYELGIAQALGKSTIIVAQHHDDVPFDVRQQQIVLYSDLRDLREKLLVALSRSAASF